MAHVTPARRAIVAALAFASSTGIARAQSDEQGLGDIVVTAQRREERLQDVPASISAFNAETLTNAGVTTTRDLQLVTPGLRIEAIGTYVQPVIRGVTTTQSGGQEANVATYIDGVYQTSLVSAFYNLPDVRQVEVLKGPQGTLFGRNATGGAILISTIDPDLTDITGKLTTGYGRFDTFSARGYVSAPVIEDKVALGLSGLIEDTTGWKHNLALGGRRKGADINDKLIRGKLRVAPADGVDFVLTGYYARRKDDSVLKGTPWKGNTAQRTYLIANGLPNPTEPWEFAVDIDASVKVVNKGVNLRGEIEAGPGKLKTTTAYNRLESVLVTDADLGVRPTGTNIFNENLSSFTQELVYSTDKIGRLSAVAGLFYFRSNGGFEPGISRSFLTGNSTVFWTGNKSRSWAAFGELNYDLTDQLTLTGGLRYSHERKSANASIAVNNFTEPNPVPLLGAKTWNSLTPRASLLYRVTDDVNVYATFSKGFKSGTFNPTALQRAPVDPEKITAFEGGIKSTIGNELLLNAAAFHYSYSDLQVPTISQDGIRLIQSLTNAAKAKIYGAELSGTFRPSQFFNVTFGGTYLHARYSSFPSASDNVPLPAGGNQTVAINAAGNVMTRSPKWSANLAGSYRIPVGAGEVELSGSLYYSSRVFFDVINRVNQPAYATANAALAWRPDDNGVEFRIWGKNLTNHAVISATTISAAYDSIDYLPPRQYGVEVSLTF